MTEEARDRAVAALAAMFVAFRPTNASKANYAGTASRKAERLLSDLDANPAARQALAAWLDEWCGECGFGRKYHPRGHEWTATGIYGDSRPPESAAGAESDAPVPFAYPGQHDDCIATVPHHHDRPYKSGEWSATFDEGWATPPTSVPESAAPSLDAAWQKAEAALPPLWDKVAVYRFNDEWTVRFEKQRSYGRGGAARYDRWTGAGDSFEAALLNLAERLTATPALREERRPGSHAQGDPDSTPSEHENREEPTP